MMYDQFSYDFALGKYFGNKIVHHLSLEKAIQQNDSLKKVKSYGGKGQQDSVSVNVDCQNIIRVGKMKITKEKWNDKLGYCWSQ